MRLKIASVGEPVLRAPSHVLSKEQILNPSIQDLIELMRETMRDAPGVGLAAPQVGESLQLVVIEDKPEYQKLLTERELKERERRAVPFHVLVNPVLELITEPTLTFFEGCLSLPGFTALVARAKEVRVHCLDHRGELRVIDASGWYARILQHEMDHLHGTLYIDRMLSPSFSTLENYTRHWKDRSSNVAGSAENEHFSLLFARAAGLIVPNSSVQHFGDEIAIVVERYDRVRSGGRWARIHQEDMCQALGLHPTRKYESDGGSKLQSRPLMHSLDT